MRAWFWGLLSLGLVLRLSLALLTPLQDKPAIIPYFNDEPAHFNHVEYIAQTGRLPVQTSNSQNAFDRYEFEYYQAPLYYFITSPFYRLGEKLTPGYEYLYLRFLSVLFSLGGLVVLYSACRRFFEQEGIALSVLLIGAVGGIPLRFGSLVTNDSLLFAVACLYFALILQIVSAPCDRRLFIAGVLVAAAGLWTKASFLVLLPLLPWVLLRSPNRSIVKAVGAVILPLAAILPWYLRNRSLYGRIIPIEVGFGPVDPIVQSNALERILNTGNYFVRSFVFPYDQLWGGFLDHPVYVLVALLLVVFGVFGLIVLWKRGTFWFWIFAGAIALNALSYLFFNILRFQAEARLLMPSLPFILVILSLGAFRIVRESTNRAMVLLGLWVALPWVSAML
jgi:hypothetical protein